MENRKVYKQGVVTIIASLSLMVAGSGITMSSGDLVIGSSTHVVMNVDRVTYSGAATGKIEVHPPRHVSRRSGCAPIEEATRRAEEGRQQGD